MLLQVLINGLLIGGVYALIASGLAFIYGPVDLVNFAHGDLVMVAMYIALLGGNYLNLNVFTTVFLALVIMIIIGYTVYFILRPVLTGTRLSQALATYGLGLTMQSIIIFFMGPDYRTVTNPTFGGSISLYNLNLSTPRLMAGIVSLGTFAILYIFLSRTTTGKAIQAMAQNREGALVVGINLEKMYKISFAVSASCAAISGVLLAQYFYVFPSAGRPLLLLGFVAMVIGGFGSMPGALLGGIVVGLFQTIIGFYISPAFKDVAIYLLFILLMVYKPKGLFGI